MLVVNARGKEEGAISVPEADGELEDTGGRTEAVEGQPSLVCKNSWVNFQFFATTLLI